MTELGVGNGRLYFRASDGVSGLETGTTDGTPAGTVQVKDIYPGAVGAYPTCLVTCNRSQLVKLVRLGPDGKATTTAAY